MFQGSGKGIFCLERSLHIFLSILCRISYTLDFSRLDTFYLYVDSSNITVKFPLLAWRILTSLSSFTGFNITYSFLIMLDVKGFEIFSIQTKIHTKGKEKFEPCRFSHTYHVQIRHSIFHCKIKPLLNHQFF